MAITLSTDDTRREAFLTAEQAKVQTGGGGTDDHRQLTHRSDPNQHPISAIKGLQDELDGKLNDDDISDWAKKPRKPIYDSAEIDDDTYGDVSTALSVLSKKTAENENAVDGINAKIPAQASATNQLADKDFVNSSIENVAAYYITKDAAGNPFATKAELNAATVYYSGGQVRVPTRNDYTVVLHDESKLIGEEAPTTRYLYFNGWNYQYIVNNSGLTADQWKAVNSGATAEIIESVANKQDKLTAGDRISIDADNVISAEEQVLIVTADFDEVNMTISNADHTFEEIAAAYNARKVVFLRAGYYEMEATAKTRTAVQFTAPEGSITYTVTIRSSGVWSASKIEKVAVIGDNPTDLQYPSALATKNYVDAIVGNVETLLANI